MAYSSAFSQSSSALLHSPSLRGTRSSALSHSTSFRDTRMRNPRRFGSPFHYTYVIGVKSAATDPSKDTIAQTDDSSKAASAAPKPPPKKPVYSMKKGQIVRVDKEKYLNSVNYLSVGHPPYYKGLDYIYEDRGEVLDIRIFETTGEYALIAWVGIPTAPAWLPTDMLIKSERLNYERI